MENFVKLINHLGKNVIYSVSIKTKNPKAIKNPPAAFKKLKQRVKGRNRARNESFIYLLLGSDRRGLCACKTKLVFR